MHLKQGAATCGGVLLPKCLQHVPVAMFSFSLNYLDRKVCVIKCIHGISRSSLIKCANGEKEETSKFW